MFATGGGAGPAPRLPAFRARRFAGSQQFSQLKIDTGTGIMKALRVAVFVWAAAALPVATSAAGPAPVITIGGCLAQGGKHSEKSEQLWEVYSMFRDRVNSEGGIDVGGTRHEVELYFEDDNSEPDSVAAILPHMLNESVSRCVDLHGPCRRTDNASWALDFVFSGFGTASTRPAAEVAEAAGKVLMVGSSSSESLFQAHERMFGTLTRSARYTEDAIRAFVLRGARKVAYANLDSGFAKGACSWIPSSVARMNETLNTKLALARRDGRLNEVSTVHGGTGFLGEPGKLPVAPSEEEMEAQVLALKAADPDVFVGCFNYDACRLFLETAERLLFEPSGVLLTLCVSDPNFLDDMGDNARYAIGNVQWDKRLPIRGAFDGMSAAEFQEWYAASTGKAGVDVRFQTASHFASALALKAALEQAGSLDAAEVAFALSRLDISTFFGRVRFDSNGQGGADVIYTQFDHEGEYQIVLPETLATASIIYPQRSYTTRACMREHGEDSCLCSPLGCPACTSMFWDFTALDCDANGQVQVTHFWRDDVTCEGGEQLPAPVVRECAYVCVDSRVGIFTYVVAVLCGVICLCMLATVVFFRKRAIMRLAQMRFSVGIILCATADCFGVLSYLGPHTSLACLVRPWIANVPFACMCSLLIVKVLRASRLVTAMQSPGGAERRGPRSTISSFNADVALGLCLAGFPVVAIAVGEGFASSVPVNIGDKVSSTTTVDFVVCRAEDGSTTLAAVLSMYKGVLLVTGLYRSFLCRHIYNKLAETASLAQAFCNIATLWVIGNLIWVFTQQVMLHVIFLCIAHAVASAGTILIIFVPKLFSLNVSAAELVASTIHNSHKEKDDKYGSAKSATVAPSNLSLTPALPHVDSTDKVVHDDALGTIAALRKQVARLEKQIGLNDNAEQVRDGVIEDLRLELQQLKHR